MKKILITILILNAVFIASAKSSKTKIISKEQAIEDVWHLKYTLEITHPNIYYSLPEVEFKKKLDDIVLKFDDEVNCDSLSLWLTPVINLLNDGHTSVWGKSADKKIAQGYFSLKLDLKNNSVVQNNTFDIPKGAIVTSINSISTSTIVENLIVNVAGERYDYRVAKLEYELPYWLYLVYGFEKQFVIDYDYDNEQFTKTIGGQKRSNFYLRYAHDIEGDFNILERNDIKYGYFKLSMFGDSKDYFRLVEKVFKQLNDEGVNELIIDIRDNPGGNTNLADKMFQYLAKEPYMDYESITCNYSKTSRRFFQNYGFKKPYLMPLLMMTPYYWKAKGEDVREGHANELYLDSTDVYRGNTYLVTSNYCFSTADDFARAFKYNNMGTIIGEETGGMKESYGDVALFKLPNSKIKCGCSYKVFKGLDLNDKPSDGVKPDVEVDCDNYTDDEILQMVSQIVNKRN